MALHPDGLVCYDYENDCCKEERVVKRRDADKQKCKHGKPLEKLFPSSKRWGDGYPKVISTLPGDPVAQSPAHYKRLLKENGVVNRHGGNGWT